jgi:hypothetical protein
MWKTHKPQRERVGPLEEIAVIFGMVARDRFQLAAVAELFERVGPRRVKQAVARDGAVDLRRDERFRDQAGNAVDDFRRRGLGARCDRTGRF